MKVTAFNGSPRKGGNCEIALNYIGEELKKEGIEFEIVQVGNQMVRGCLACYKCLETGSHYHDMFLYPSHASFIIIFSSLNDFCRPPPSV